MARLMFEFERGKGSRLDWQQENVAMFGPRASYMNRSFKRGPYRPTQRREGAIYPLRWYPIVRKHDIYLTMRERIGHGHFKGLRPNT